MMVITETETETETEQHGGFSKRRARRRKGKINEKLCRVIDVVIPKSSFVVDMGAGAYGSYVRWMRKNGWEDAWGIDASPNSEELSEGLVKVRDLIQPSTCWNLFNRQPHWAIFYEVGEHVPNEFRQRLFANLSIVKTGVLLSWATPGQRGHNHINCRMPEWVACEMGSIDFKLDEKQTTEARKVMGRNNRKIMVFTKQKGEAS